MLCVLDIFRRRAGGRRGQDEEVAGGDGSGADPHSVPAGKRGTSALRAHPGHHCVHPPLLTASTPLLFSPFLVAASAPFLGPRMTLLATHATVCMRSHNVIPALDVLSGDSSALPPGLHHLRISSPALLHPLVFHPSPAPSCPALASAVVSPGLTFPSHAPASCPPLSSHRGAALAPPADTSLVHSKLQTINPKP